MSANNVGEILRIIFHGSSFTRFFHGHDVSSTIFQSPNRVLSLLSRTKLSQVGFKVKLKSSDHLLPLWISMIIPHELLMFQDNTGCYCFEFRINMQNVFIYYLARNNVHRTNAPGHIIIHWGRQRHPDIFMRNPNPGWISSRMFLVTGYPTPVPTPAPTIGECYIMMWECLEGFVYLYPRSVGYSVWIGDIEMYSKPKHCKTVWWPLA